MTLEKTEEEHRQRIAEGRTGSVTNANEEADKKVANSDEEHEKKEEKKEDKETAI